MTDKRRKKLDQATAGGPPQTLSAALETLRALPPSRKRPGAVPASSEWHRGYFCAVSALLRSEGLATTAVRELFRSGGDWRRADADDIALFEQHGLTNPEN